MNAYAELTNQEALEKCACAVCWELVKKKFSRSFPAADAVGLCDPLIRKGNWPGKDGMDEHGRTISFTFERPFESLCGLSLLAKAMSATETAATVRICNTCERYLLLTMVIALSSYV